MAEGPRQGVAGDVCVVSLPVVFLGRQCFFVRTMATRLLLLPCLGTTEVDAINSYNSSRSCRWCSNTCGAGEPFVGTAYAIAQKLKRFDFVGRFMRILLWLSFWAKDCFGVLDAAAAMLLNFAGEHLNGIYSNAAAVVCTVSRNGYSSVYRVLSIGRAMTFDAWFLLRIFLRHNFARKTVTCTGTLRFCVPYVKYL